VLLGAAPGVGKTYAMLNEGRRRKSRGADVVVALLETHGREQTIAQVGDLEVVPRRTIEYQGASFTEMDLDAVLERHPMVALVDELAHHNVPGSRNERRCEDIAELLDAGIDVITTVNVQHLESLNDVVTSITGVKQRETVPDTVVRAADQIELVDMAPEALRRRLAHGNVYAASKIDAALNNYFRPGNLAALRELALLWVADRVDAGLADYRRTHAIGGTWPTRERVVVALSGGPEGAVLLRRGAQIAGRGVGGELHATYVARTDGLVARDARDLAEQQRLTADLSGQFHTLTGDDPAEAVLEYARTVNATQIVAGSSRRSWWQRLLGSSVSERIIAGSGDIDVHVVTHRWAHDGRHRAAQPLSRPRRLLGLALAVVLPAVAVPAVSLIGGTDTEGALMVFLALTVAVALVGGIVPAVVAAVVGSLLVNWFFTPPLQTFTVADPRNLGFLALYLVVGVAVAGVVDQAARRSRQAAASRAEADTLFLLVAGSGRGGGSLDEILETIRRTFRLDGVEIRIRDAEGAPWQVERAVGEVTGEPATQLEVGDREGFALYGKGLRPSDQRVLVAYGAEVLQRRERAQLAETAAAAEDLAARDALHTALLAAVSHDLRTPLAAIKAGSSSLLSTDVELPASDRRVMAELIDTNADRLARLIGNLLDMTRLQTGAFNVRDDDVLLDEVLRPVLARAPVGRVSVEHADDLPMVRTDPGLAERVMANLVDNAMRHQPPGQPVRVMADVVEDRIEVRVVDTGPGVPPSRREEMFRPFQRLGDAPQGAGLGLGLAVVAGFVAAIGATLARRRRAEPGAGARHQPAGPWLPYDHRSRRPRRTGGDDGASHRPGRARPGTARSRRS